MAASNSILTDGLGEIPSDPVLVRHMKRLPPPVGEVHRIELFKRPYHAEILRSHFHMPTTDEIRMARTLDRMLRTSYRRRNPDQAKTWQSIYDAPPGEDVEGDAPAALLTGVSGVGKSVSVSLALSRYRQTIRHDRFPKVVGPLTQLTWLKVSVPPTGRLVDLVETLIQETVKALDAPEIGHTLRRRTSERALSCFNRWCTFMQAHFLGLLVLDEVQNLFKIPSLEQRRRRNYADGLGLRIADDETLKALLIFSSTSKIPLLLIGTHDAERALESRFAISQRLAEGGQHELRFPMTAEDRHFAKELLPKLAEYQWSDTPIEVDDALRNRIHKFTAGIHRLVVNLWITAHQVAAHDGHSSLTITHFEQAANLHMKSAREAVAVLLSDLPDRLTRYEDLAGLLRNAGTSS